MADSVSRHPLQSDWIANTCTLLSRLPQDYLQFRSTVAALSDAFHEQAAAEMQPRINSFLKTMPQTTYEERQKLASFVNHELRQLGLTIRCPKTGYPAILIADVKDAEHGTGRFRLEARLDGGRKARTRTSSTLFELELMKDVVRKEGMSRWTPQQGPK